MCARNESGRQGVGVVRFSAFKKRLGNGTDARQTGNPAGLRRAPRILTRFYCAPFPLRASFAASPKTSPNPSEKLEGTTTVPPVSRTLS